VLASWEGPRTPLLGVRDLQDARDERRSTLASGLVTARFRACGVEIGTCSTVGRVGVESLVLCAEAAWVCATDSTALAGGEKDAFHVFRVRA
jgi:hypothetical protein